MRADQAAARPLSRRPLLLSTLPDFLTSPLNALAAVIPQTKKRFRRRRNGPSAAPRRGRLCRTSTGWSASQCPHLQKFMPSSPIRPDRICSTGSDNGATRVGGFFHFGRRRFPDDGPARPRSFSTASRHTLAQRGAHAARAQSSRCTFGNGRSHFAV